LQLLQEEVLLTTIPALGSLMLLMQQSCGCFARVLQQLLAMGFTAAASSRTVNLA
jgi:hypothetical protein